MEEIGILKWVLDNSQAKKMDDFLPIMMFNTSNIANALKMNNPSLAIALTPATLLIESVMSNDMTRNQRLSYLSLCWAFFWVYKTIYNNCQTSQTSSKMKGKNMHMMIYDKNTIDKALSLCYSLSIIISDSRTVHLGALGTHWLEHFFGKIRQLCKRNDTPKNFMRCALQILFQKFQGSADVKIKKKLSDSGAILREEVSERIVSPQIGSFIHEALLLLHCAYVPYTFKYRAYFFLIQNYFKKRSIETYDDFLKLFYNVNVPFECSSTSQARMTSVSGYKTLGKFVQANQITK